MAGSRAPDPAARRPALPPLVAFGPHGVSVQGLPPGHPLDALPGGPEAAYTALRALPDHRVASLDDHLARLRASAAALGWGAPADDAVRGALAAALRAGPAVDRDVVVEITPRGGHVVAWPRADRSPPPGGARVARARPGARRRLPGAKDSAWRRARLDWQTSPSADDHLLEAPDGALLEGFTSALVFLAGDEAWLPLGPALPSLTVARLRPLLAAQRRVVDRRVTWDDLPRVTEVGLASALRGLWPVRQLGDVALPAGPALPALSAALEVALERDACHPWRDR